MWVVTIEISFFLDSPAILCARDKVCEEEQNDCTQHIQQVKRRIRDDLVPPPPPPPRSTERHASTERNRVVVMEIKEHGMTRPGMRMTVQLMTTYKQINMVYYKSRRAKQVEKAVQSKDLSTGLTKQVDPAKKIDKIMAGHYTPVENEILHGRYRITRTRLGMGTFGQVLEAFDEELSKGVAIKIIKNQPHLAAQAESEVKILEYMHTSPHADRSHIVKLLDTFMHKGHKCLVFPLCSYDLLDLLRCCRFKGVSLKLVRKFAKQIIESLVFLSEAGIIHCDLKPENIVIARPNRSNIKIIDFGSSCRSDKRVYSYIQSRFYRAPEVILGMKYTTAIDMWSVGCILVELHTGKPLFEVEHPYDHLDRITQITGAIPAHIMEQVNPLQKAEYFEQIVENGEPTRNFRVKKAPAKKLSPLSLATDPAAYAGPQSLFGICTLEGRDERRLDKEPDHSADDYDHFIDLVQRMLDIDPQRRITPAAALNHPFFQAPQMQTRIGWDKKRTTDPRVDATQEDVAMGEDDPNEVFTHRAKQRKLLVPSHDDGV
ncbi:Aste57867_11658 [Aphanomyces stellatus]|uniref:Aste57867_11658 protein n=1 Tax=Aphanomyces stellatus TaxID=120398 RepID=A0A485KTV0_9STRA|nr:hypothetical protein As57867_011615 [Aphanomyces stellatus]VFT88516.1 Aste57867_11658 [Aphanomyces stellatus]